jgi:hypothetical protein
MELSKATLELLRDEAYVFLCRKALQDRSDQLDREKTQLASSRPPFGLLARKQTRDAYATSVRTTLETEEMVNDRFARLARFDVLLQRSLRRDLVEYLRQASPEYQRFVRIQQLLNEWEYCVQHLLPDSLSAFARDLRAVRQAATTAVPGPQQCTRELVALREVAVRLEEQQTHLNRITASFNDTAKPLSRTDVQIPTLPNFRRTVWVDWLSVVPIDQIVLEVTRVEMEIRAFVTTGLEPALGRLQGSRNACTLLQDNFLQTYWNRLRAHAQSNYVESRDVDQVLSALAENYGAALRYDDGEPVRDAFMTER